MPEVKLVGNLQNIIEDYCLTDMFYSGEFKMNMKKEDKGWKFNVVHPSFIDENEIMQELTRKNPLLLISVDGGNYQAVAIHYSLLDKYEHSQIVFFSNDVKHELETRNASYMDQKGNLFLYTNCQFHEWINWAKGVKEAKWLSEIKNPVDVKISVPTI